jgi:hypothetical protein
MKISVEFITNNGKYLTENFDVRYSCYENTPEGPALKVTTENGANFFIVGIINLNNVVLKLKNNRTSEATISAYEFDSGRDIVNLIKPELIIHILYKVGTYRCDFVKELSTEDAEKLIQFKDISVFKNYPKASLIYNATRSLPTPYRDPRSSKRAYFQTIFNAICD